MKKLRIRHYIDRPNNQSQPKNNLTFKEIYEAINYEKDFNEPQLFYLSRLIDRKLKAFDPRLRPEDLLI